MSETARIIAFPSKYGTECPDQPLTPKEPSDWSEKLRGSNPGASSPRRRTGQIVADRYRVGSLYRQPSGCWAARITDLTDGKTFKRSSGCLRKAEARRALHALLEAMETEETQETNPLFSETVSEYLTLREPHLRPATRKDYKSSYAMLSEEFGERPLRSLGYGDIEDYICRIAADGRARTAAKHLTLIRAFLGWCLRRELIEKDPSAGLKPPRHQTREFRLPTPDEARKLLQACSQAHTRKAAALGFLTGLRRGTILALRVADLDVEEKAIRVDGSRMKAGKPIEMPVRDDLLALLLDGLPSDPDARLIGRRVSNISRSFDTTRKKAGMEWLVFHSTRRAYGSWLAAAGTDYFIIKELLGHSLSGDVTTLYINSAMLAERKREAVNRLPAIL